MIRTRSASRVTHGNGPLHAGSTAATSNMFSGRAPSGASPEWDSRFENWKYRVTGTDLDGQELTLIVALDLAWSRITVVTGF